MRKCYLMIKLQSAIDTAQNKFNIIETLHRFYSQTCSKFTVTTCKINFTSAYCPLLAKVLQV